MSRNKRKRGRIATTGNEINSYFNSTKGNFYFDMFFNYLQTLAISRFKWDGLPEEIPPSALEMMLIRNREIQFFKDDETGLYAILPVSEYGIEDIYGHGENRMSAMNQAVIFRDKSNSVVLRDSITGYPTINYCIAYADYLTNLKITKQMNTYALRTPVIFAGSSDMELTLKNVFKDYNDAVPYIPLVDTVANTMKIQAVDTKAQFHGDKLDYSAKRELVEFLTIIGIPAIDNTKRERQVGAEINSNSGETEISQNSYLDLRKRACGQINKMFGLNVSVDYNGELNVLMELEDSEDVAIHTDDKRDN